MGVGFSFYNVNPEDQTQFFTCVIRFLNILCLNGYFLKTNMSSGFVLTGNSYC